MGLYALANQAAAVPLTAHFDYFLVTPDDTATPCEPGGEAPVVETTVSPEAPTGKNGWYRGPVTVPATATGGVGDVELEHRVDGGDWVASTEPVVVDEDGEHTVEFRATDSEGTQSEPAAVTVKIDATAPTLAVKGVKNGDQLSVAAQRRLRLTVGDQASGVARQVVKVDGKALTAPYVVDAVALLSGRHRVVVTVTDAAGNVTTQRMTFRVVPTYRGARQLVARLDQEDRLAPKVARKMTRQLVNAARFDRKNKVRQARKALTTYAQLGRRADDRSARVALRDVSRQLKRKL
ncbi:hypothetical protein [Nocardioides sp. TF02-7]|uniref:OmpL47-type beta-barrel domain-containing protein n=1 Tax=Nocardioides sp. TF02-7 TaxID=2917724 RepID=UPI001F069620|nr:hypothetical protein [Nocardioides sp. TF02-7]UMG93967.1 hypothetical protein MF408_07725 [Nocardioides sp. TF02-7]